MYIFSCIITVKDNKIHEIWVLRFIFDHCHCDNTTVAVEYL